MKGREELSRGFAAFQSSSFQSRTQQGFATRTRLAAAELRRGACLGLARDRLISCFPAAKIAIRFDRKGPRVSLCSAKNCVMMIRSIDDLVGFLKRFHRGWLDDPSLGPSLIPPDVPEGLATIHRELGALVEIEDSRNRAPFASQDCLMPLSRLKRVDGMLVFSWENQGNWSCRCQPGEPDPPVYSNAADAWNEEQRGFVVVCNSLNHFLITLCLQEALYSCRNLIAIEGHPRPEEAITERLAPLWLGGWYVNTGPSHDFFVTSDHEVLVMNYAGVWIGSPSRSVQPLVVSGLNSMVLAGA
jgi:hypothetical protein